MESYATSYSPSFAGPGAQSLREKAEELESVFLNTLVSEMFSGIDADSDFASDTWRSMQSEQFAAAMARAGGIGIADQVMSSLLQAQESVSPDAAGPSAYRHGASA